MKKELEELKFEVTSSQEKDILEILIDNFDSIPNLSILEISTRCYCSSTSVTRVIKKLGYKGYSDYQSQVSFNLKNKLRELDCDDKFNVLNPDIDDLVKQIKSEKVLYIYGKGASYLSAQYLYRLLLEKDFVPVLLTEQDFLYGLKDKYVIILSKSGETDSVCKIAKELKENQGCTIVSFTRQNSALDKVSSYSFVHDNQNNLSRNDQIELFLLINKIMYMF
ncbi:MAG: MurR/RpiR family transcriptional regulator [Mycoplasmatales bacterium]